MKRIFFLTVTVFAGANVFSQTLVTYGNSTIDKSEFLRAYNKNKPATTDKEKSMRDYMELYTNFKLKVKAAQEQHIDTIAQIKYDTENFREQIAANYMDNEKGMQQLTDEAASRSARDLHVIYFTVPVPENASPADTMKAYNAITTLYNKLKTGSADYAETVTDVSTKIFPAKYSDAGFVTAFTVPYEMENVIYNTKPGNVSSPYRTGKAWFIFKVTEEKPDPGKWKAAQILFAYPPDADYNTKLAVKQKADSVYALLKNGLAFDAAAKQYSDDRITYQAGGELPEFSTGRYTPAFENNVFALQHDNDITKPFETPFGYHIVKRLSNTIPVRNDAAYNFELRQRVMQDARVNAEKEQFVHDITAATGYKRTSSVNDADLYRYADSISKFPGDVPLKPFPISNKTIISFKDGSQIKGEEWLKFVKENGNAESAKMPAKQLWKKFSSQTILNYYKKHLDDYNDDFKYQMQEFKEGNMLFEIMERNVWSMAGADSVGLLSYYNAHKENYKWANSADVLIVNCTDEKAAADAIEKLKGGKSWQKLAEESNSRIQADSGRYELSQIPGTQAGTPQAGTYSNIIKNSDGTASFIKYIRIYDPNMQRSFSESRGLVINDYQNVLEEKWVTELRKKYPVKINEPVFAQMIK